MNEAVLPRTLVYSWKKETAPSTNEKAAAERPVFAE